MDSQQRMGVISYCMLNEILKRRLEHSGCVWSAWIMILPNYIFVLNCSTCFIFFYADQEELEKYSSLQTEISRLRIKSSKSHSSYKSHEGKFVLSVLRISHRSR